MTEGIDEGQTGRHMKKTILLVDDDDIARRSTSALLTTIGHEVVPATGGREAVEIYRQRAKEIDLVLLDVIMPGMDGVQTYGQLEKIDPAVKVILMSGYTSDAVGELVRQLLARGCCGFIKKPFHLQELQESITKALEIGPPT